MIVEYSSNNSGGDWWLTDADWYALENAGWTVAWFSNGQADMYDKDGRWLGALASEATREGLSLREAIEEWEEITGQTSTSLGCSCCGSPHSFSFTDNDGRIEYYYPEFPLYGEPYHE